MLRSDGVGAVPGQQRVDVGLFVACGDGRQDAGQIAVGFGSVEFAGLDKGGDDGPILRASIVSGEERVFAVECDGADRSLSGVGIQLDAAIVEEPDQPSPIFCDVSQGFSGGRL